MNIYVEAVKELAEELHEGQKRLDGKPYILHPIEVADKALKVKNLFNLNHLKDDVLLSAAYLHDVLEDCDISFKDLRMSLEGIFKDFEKALQIATVVWELSANREETPVMAALKWNEDYTFLIKWADILCNNKDGHNGNEEKSSRWRSKKLQQVSVVINKLDQRTVGTMVGVLHNTSLKFLWEDLEQILEGNNPVHYDLSTFLEM